MTKPDVLVGTIHSILPTGEKRVSAAKPLLLVTMKLHGGRSVQLDMSMPQSKAWADILTSLHQSKQAVYLKIDPQTGIVADLLLPRAVRVASVKAANLEGDVEVELIISAARHYLRRANPDYKKLLKTLEDALKTGIAVLVTDSRDRQEIIDVRPVPETMSAPGYLAVPLARPASGETRTVPKQGLSPSGKGGAKCANQFRESAKLARMKDVPTKGRVSAFNVTPYGNSALRNIRLKAGVRSQASLVISLPLETRPGEYDIALLQKINGKEVGRVTRRLVITRKVRKVA